MMRARASAGPLLRVLAMAVLLFGVVVTHGVNVEGVKGHAVTSAVVPATVLPEQTPDSADPQALPRPAAMAEPHESHGSSHPSEHCVSGQPQQGPVLTPPCFAVSVGESGESATSGLALAQRGPNGSVLSVSSAAALRLSVVQQV
jgi:hypothetical protein